MSMSMSGGFVLSLDKNRSNRKPQTIGSKDVIPSSQQTSEPDAEPRML